eukprot:1639647-Amphidinium_carterae.1
MSPDLVTVGAGVRTDVEHTLLFEKVVRHLVANAKEGRGIAELHFTRSLASSQESEPLPSLASIPQSRMDNECRYSGNIMSWSLLSALNPLWQSPMSILLRVCYSSPGTYGFVQRCHATVGRVMLPCNSWESDAAYMELILVALLTLMESI